MESVSASERLVCHDGVSGLPAEIFKAHEMIWNNDLYGTKKFLQELVQQMQEEGKRSAWITLALTETLFWEQGMHMQDKALRKELEKSLDETDKFAEDILDRFNPESTIGGLLRPSLKISEDEKMYRYLIGLVCSAYSILMRSFYHFRVEEPIRGAFYFRKSWTVFAKCIKIQNKREEKNYKQDTILKGFINFGVGVFHLTFSLIPPSFQIITAIVGFDADRQEGIKELYHCYESGCLMAPPAGIILVMVEFWLLKDEAKADALYQRVRREYPESFIVGYFGGFMLRMKGDLNGALDAFQVTQNFASENGFKQLVASTYYSMGYVNAMLSRWDLSEQHFQTFISTPIEVANKNFRPWAAYVLAIACWINHKDDRETLTKEKIVPMFQKALRDWIREEESYDIYSKRKMKNFIANNCFSDLEVICVQISVAVEGKQTDLATQLLQELEEMLDDNCDRDYYALFNLYHGEVCKIGKDFSGAEKYHQQAIAEEDKVKHETWVSPYALTSLAEVAAEQADWETVKQNLKKLKKYSKYDWEKIIAFRVYSLKQTLREKTGSD